jgi:putative NADH-flavin reductase
MKHMIVFGASGRTGKYIVKYALEAGYKVTAFVHREAYDIVHDNLDIVVGDVYDDNKVISSIKGHDVVISSLGTQQIEGDAVDLMSDAMKIFVGAMELYGIKRVLAIGGIGVLQLNETMQILDKPDYPAQFKNVGEGHNKVFHVLRQTDLDWTFVCCPDIILGDKTGKYAVKKNYPAEGIGHILTGDLADFIIKESSENNFLRTRVGINNTE